MSHSTSTAGCCKGNLPETTVGSVLQQQVQETSFKKCCHVEENSPQLPDDTLHRKEKDSETNKNHSIYCDNEEENYEEICYVIVVKEEENKVVETENIFTEQSESITSEFINDISKTKSTNKGYMTEDHAGLLMTSSNCLAHNLNYVADTSKDVEEHMIQNDVDDVTKGDPQICAFFSSSTSKVNHQVKKGKSEKNINNEITEVLHTQETSIDNSEGRKNTKDINLASLTCCKHSPTIVQYSENETKRRRYSRNTKVESDKQVEEAKLLTTCRQSETSQVLSDSGTRLSNRIDSSDNVTTGSNKGQSIPHYEENTTFKGVNTKYEAVQNAYDMDSNCSVSRLVRNYRTRKSYIRKRNSGFINGTTNGTVLPKTDGGELAGSDPGSELMQELSTSELEDDMRGRPLIT